MVHTDHTALKWQPEWLRVLCDAIPKCSSHYTKRICVFFYFCYERWIHLSTHQILWDSSPTAECKLCEMVMMSILVHLKNLELFICLSPDGGEEKPTSTKEKATKERNWQKHPFLCLTHKD